MAVLCKGMAQTAQQRRGKVMQEDAALWLSYAKKAKQGLSLEQQCTAKAEHRAGKECTAKAEHRTAMHGNVWRRH